MTLISSIKYCGRCEKDLPIEEFTKDRSKKDGLTIQCTKCNHECAGKYRTTDKGREAMRRGTKKYRTTLKGYLRQVFHAINRRCNSPNCEGFKYYGSRGIQNKFASLDEFRDYVVNELGITSIGLIKGLQIHRIDNNGDYVEGNIEFLTRTEHTAAHVKLRGE